MIVNEIIDICHKLLMNPREDFESYNIKENKIVDYTASIAKDNSLDIEVGIIIEPNDGNQIVTLILHNRTYKEQVNDNTAHFLRTLLYQLKKIHGKHANNILANQLNNITL